MMFKKTQRILSYLLVASIAVLPSSVFSAESSLPYPKEAQIIHYPQFHSDETPPNSVLADLGLDLKGIVHTIAQSQLSLLQILRDDPGLKVFGEGYASDDTKESVIDRQKNRGLRNFEYRILSAFKNGLPKNIKTSTPEQIGLLGVLSDGIDIALILDYVKKTYKTEDPEVNKKVDATLKDSDKDNYYREAFDKRERILKKEIEENSNKGDRVLIVYGMGHELSYLFDTIYRIPVEIGPSMNDTMMKLAFIAWTDRLIDLREKGHPLEAIDTVHWNEDGSLEASYKLFKQFAKHPKEESFEAIAGTKHKEAAKKSACPPQFNNKSL